MVVSFTSWLAQLYENQVNGVCGRSFFEKLQDAFFEDN